jgi:hypothetical protein
MWVVPLTQIGGMVNPAAMKLIALSGSVLLSMCICAPTKGAQLKREPARSGIASSSQSLGLTLLTAEEFSDASARVANGEDASPILRVAKS